VLTARHPPQRGDCLPPRRHCCAAAQLAACSQDEGFTLVEILVALAILSVSLTLVLRTLSDGFHYQQRAQALADATFLAQSLMARVGGDLPLKPGIEEGTLPNGLAWKVQIDPYGSDSERREWTMAAYAVAIEVSSGRGAATSLIALNSLKLGPKDASR
jgi:general secretion pathway protein I